MQSAYPGVRPNGPMANVRIGSVFGIPVELGTSFLLVVPLIAYLVAVQVEMTTTLLNDLLGGTIDPGPLTTE